jgi:hypothetical protein
VASALALGNHRLAPAKAFENVAAVIAEARRAIDDLSLSFVFIKGARYVPAQNMDKLRARLAECREKFTAEVDTFIEGYEATKGEMLPVIRKALRDAARPVPATLGKNDEILAPARTADEVAAAAYERVLGEYPSADEVREKFRLIWNVYAVQGPKAEGAAAAMEGETDTVKSVLRDMVAGLREEVTTKLAEVLALIQKGGKLHERSLESARAVLARVDAVNVLGDEELTRQVSAFRRALDGVRAGERVGDATVTGLADVAKALSADLEEATAAAEAKLTGVGRRKLAVA